MITRRTFITGSTSALLYPGFAAAKEPMPTLFFGHGGPSLGLDDNRRRELQDMARQLPHKPSGIIAFTPHVRARHVTFASTGIARWSYPSRFRSTAGHLRYYPPAAPELSARLSDALRRANIRFSAQGHAGFNHTVWMGLIHLFPDADIPVVEVAMPFEASERLFQFGRALAPLRNDNVLILSSGTVTHNLASTRRGSAPPSWATEFDQWLTEAVARNSIDEIIDWRHKGPAAYIAHPDDGGHFNVLMFALGAAVGDQSGILRSRTMHAGYEFGTLSSRGFVLG